MAILAWFAGISCATISLIGLGVSILYHQSRQFMEWTLVAALFGVGACALLRSRMPPTAALAAFGGLFLAFFSVALYRLVREWGDGGLLYGLVIGVAVFGGLLAFRVF